MRKNIKLAILVTSLLFTLPACGFLFTKSPLIGTIIYLTQLGTSVELIRTWVIYKKIEEENAKLHKKQNGFTWFN
jgi:hypothetical protein